MNVDNLPPELLKFLVYLLAAGFVATGVALLGVLGYLARGVLAKLKNIEEVHADEFKKFGQALAGLKDLVTEKLHGHDKRINSLEEWRQRFGGDKG